MTPDQIRRSWDDDDTPRSVFPEPLAERLTRENKELRAEIERLRTAAERCGEAHHVALNQLECPVCGNGEDGCCVCQQMIRAESAEARLNALVADLEAAIADKGKLHSTWDKRSEMVVPVDDLRAVLDKHAGEQP